MAEILVLAELNPAGGGVRKTTEGLPHRARCR